MRHECGYATGFLRALGKAVPNLADGLRARARRSVHVDGVKDEGALRTFRAFAACACAKNPGFGVSRVLGCASVAGRAGDY